MTTIASPERARRLFHPRTWPLWAAVLAATAGILIVGAPGPWPFGHSAGQADVNLGPGDRFTPASVTVHEGDTVTWHFDGHSHTVTAGGAAGQSFDSGGKSTGTFSHTFDRAGTFPYLCVYHSGMKGTVVVLPADAATSPAATTAPAAPPRPPAARRHGAWCGNDAGARRGLARGRRGGPGRPGRRRRTVDHQGRAHRPAARPQPRGDRPPDAVRARHGHRRGPRPAHRLRLAGGGTRPPRGGGQHPALRGHARALGGRRRQGQPVGLGQPDHHAAPLTRAHLSPRRGRTSPVPGEA